MRFFKSQKGIALLEVLIVLVIMGILAVGMLSALAAASKVLLKTDARETAKNLAETEMEYIKSEPYVQAASTYNSLAIAAAQQGRYAPAVAVTPVAGRADVQKITVTITGPGITYVLEDYKIQK